MAIGAAIPDDWNGQDWECIQIQWPASEKWFSILAGLVWKAQHGRFWDENSGVITDAQQIGWEIVNRNIPFINCQGEISDNGSIQNFLSGFDDCESCEDCEMGSCGLPYGAIRWSDDGVLQYLYCGEWKDVEGPGPIGDTGTGGIDDTVPDDAGYGEPTACSLAASLANMVGQIVEQGFLLCDGIALDDLLGFWFFYNDINDAFPGIDLAFGDVTNMLAQIVPVEIAGLAGEAQDPNAVQFLKCAWQSIIPAGAKYVDAATYKTMRDTIDATLRQVWPEGSYEGFGNAIRNVWKFALSSIGDKDVEKITYYAQPAGADNCNCPEPGGVLPPPSSNGWYFSPITYYVNILGTGGFTYGTGSTFQTPPHKVYGMVFEYEYLGGDPIQVLKRNNSCLYSPDFCMVLANSDTHSVGTQYLQVANQAYADLSSQFDNPIQINQVGKVSDVIASPLADIYDTVEAAFAVRAQGNEGEAFCNVRVGVRWLHNTGDGTH